MRKKRRRSARLPLFVYGGAPGSKEGTTSAEAARRIAGRADSLRQLALNVLTRRGPMTADEVAAALGETVLAIRPRISELHAMELIEPTPKRRRNRSGLEARVWRVRNAGNEP